MYLKKKKKKVHSHNRAVRFKNLVLMMGVQAKAAKWTLNSLNFSWQKHKSNYYIEQ